MATRTLRGALAGRGRRGGLGGPAAARPARLRRPLRRHRAARSLGGPEGRRLAARRDRAAPRERRRCSGPPTRTSRRRCRSRRCCAGRSPGWPSTSPPGRGPRCSPRVHPADLPQLWGSGRAFAQATWRHVLFGLVLGELERRLNPPEEEPGRSTTPSRPRTATARPSTSSRRGRPRPEPARRHHRRVGVRGRAPGRRVPRRRRRRRRAVAQRPGSTCATPPRRAPRSRAPRPRSSSTSRRWPTSAAPGATRPPRWPRTRRST